MPPHLGPTQRREAAYRSAMTSACFAPDCIMLAMQSRPDSSWSATLRNRSRGLATTEEKVPSRCTLENASKSASRLTLVPATETAEGPEGSA